MPFLNRDMASTWCTARSRFEINRALNILQANKEFAFNMRKHQGLCWCPSMEEEARLQLNPNTDIRLKHPILRKKVSAWTQILASLIPEPENGQELEVDDRLAELVKRELYQRYDELHFYDLIDEYKHFVRMRKEMSVRAGQGRPQIDHRHFISWLANRYALATTRIQEIPCTCRGVDEIALHQILPVGSNTPQVICYNSCDRTLFAAYKRQMMRVFEPDERIATEFKEYVQGYFDRYVEPALRTFDYSYSQWFNKLPLGKQKHMVAAEEEIRLHGYPKFVEFGLFCKREKQEAGGKNRAIANIEDPIKFVMGPVCWALEDVADKFFPGYCGKKSWDDLEKYFEEMYAEGYKYILQGDGSAFDTCQHAELKVIDYLIYNYLADHGKIHHVLPDQFRRIATAKLRELNAKVLTKYGARTLASATIRGTVFSGASDTTLMNTLRMALYNMFTLEREGLRYGVDFKVLAKGDDFIVFSKVPTFKGRSFEELYLKTWSPKSKPLRTDYTNNEGKLGMILKFLNVGDYDTIDFCSVTCIPYDDHTKFKLARKPNRMVPLAHYARKTLRFSEGQIKQYLLDQATSLELSHGHMPFYRNYIEAYRYQASKIDATPKRAGAGAKRLQLPDDGHKHVETHAVEEFAWREFHDYGHEFIEGYISRQSTHTEGPSEAEVEAHLLKHFGITHGDIEFHRRFVVQQECIYDPIADC